MIPRELAGVLAGATARAATFVHGHPSLTRTEVAEALVRLRRAGMIKAVPREHRGLSEAGRPVWATGYAITGLGGEVLAGRVPMPTPKKGPDGIGRKPE